jgi:hypothetical protein
MHLPTSASVPSASTPTRAAKPAQGHPAAPTHKPRLPVDPRRIALLTRGKDLGKDMGVMARMPLGELEVAVPRWRIELETALVRRYADLQATVDLARRFGVDEPGFEEIEDLAACSDAELREEYEAVAAEAVACFQRAKQAGYAPAA